MIELKKVKVPRDDYNTLINTTLIVDTNDITKTSIFLPDSDIFHIDSLKHMFSLSHGQENVKVVDKIFESLPYKDNDKYNIAVLVNNLNNNLNELGYYASLHNLFEKYTYIAIQTKGQLGKDVFKYYSDEFINSSGLVFLDVKNNFNIIDSIFSKLEDYEIEYHIRKQTELGKGISKQNIEDIQMIKNVINTELANLKSAMNSEK